MKTEYKINEGNKESLILIIILIILCSTALTSGFIYSTRNSELSNEPNAFTNTFHTRGEYYFLFAMTSIFVFTLFWGFIYLVGKEINKLR